MSTDAKSPVPAAAPVAALAPVTRTVVLAKPLIPAGIVSVDMAEADALACEGLVARALALGISPDDVRAEARKAMRREWSRFLSGTITVVPAGAKPRK